MEKFGYLIGLFFLLVSIANGQNYTWKWAVTLSSTEPDYVWFNKIDQQGNTYTLGVFGGDYQRKLNHRSTYTQTDKTIFLVKHDADGKQLWLKETNNYTEFEINGLEVDYLGNIVVIGSYTKEFIYFLGDRLENDFLNTRSTFVARISTEGNLQWINQYSDITDEVLSNLRIDGQGNSYFLYVGDSRFLNQSDSSNLSFKSRLKNNRISRNLVKLDTKGELSWFTELEHIQINRTRIYDFEVDFEGNCYITGFYLGDYTDDLRYMEKTRIRNFLPADQWNLFLMKVNNTGTISWADQFPGVNIEVDEIGNIFLFLKLQGNFNSDYLDIGDALIESNEGENIAILKYDSEGEFQQYTTFGEILEGELVESNKSSSLFDNYSIHKETKRNETTEDEVDKVIFAYKTKDQYGNNEIIADSIFIFKNTSSERFEYGLDGNLYLLANCVGESVFGKYRSFREGLYLTSLNSDLEILNVGKQINDDNKEELRNPFLSEATAQAPAPIIQHFEVGQEGEILFYGHQYEQYLYVGGAKLNNPEFFKGHSSIWVGKLILD